MRANLGAEVRTAQATSYLRLRSLTTRGLVRDLVAKFCNVEKCWKDGEYDATAFLRLYGGVAVDFGAIFANDGYDLMRPRGGEYPGVAKDSD